MVGAMERRAIVFTGHVQGVGFRATARECARGRAVTGWVRNEPDGSVRLEIQGARAEVGAVLEELRAAMDGRIRQETESPATVDETETGFAVRR